MLLEVKDLNISYGDKLTVSGVNLELNTGEIMSIVGESGSGKPRLSVPLWAACRDAGMSAAAA